MINNYCFIIVFVTEEWKEVLIQNRDWFLSQNSILCDETRRTKKPNVKVNMLAGLEGSFRKLEVD